MRALDVYAGHSWASGHSRFADGNNNESSSEAMNAWAGMVLLGEAIGDKPMRDLGVWLFTTELSAIEDYWFGVHGDTFPPDYPASVITMVWGGKGANGTWFSGDPEMVHGINWLPITGASLYLGRYPEYAAKNYAALVKENLADETKKAAKAGKATPASGTNWSAWADIIWMYRAFSDPADALAQFNDALKAEKAGAKFPLESGNSRIALAHWLRTLEAVGTVDRSVTADTPLYAAFKKGPQGIRVAYNAGAEARAVKFSDGVTIKLVQPKSWGVWRGEK
jgi:endoglucanase Acf2